MRITLIFAAAALLPTPAMAQDFGDLVDGVTDQIEDAFAGAASGARPDAMPVGDSDAYTERWDSMRPVTFDHVIEGPPGPVTLILEGRTLDGNQTVAVYRVDRNGVRIPGWKMFVITTREGNKATAMLTLPRPPEGETVARQPVEIVVENYSGRRSQGDFALRVVP